jgi:hypothetical protein
VKKGTNREEFFAMVNNIETLSYSSAGIHLCEFSSKRYAEFKKSKNKRKRKKEKPS